MSQDSVDVEALKTELTEKQLKRADISAKIDILVIEKRELALQIATLKTTLGIGIKPTDKVSDKSKSAGQPALVG